MKVSALIGPGQVAELILRGNGVELAVSRLRAPPGYIVGEARQGAAKLVLGASGAEVEGAVAAGLVEDEGDPLHFATT